MSNIHRHRSVSSSSDIRKDKYSKNSNSLTNMSKSKHKKWICIRQPLMNLYLLSFIITFFTNRVRGFVPLSLSHKSINKSIVYTDISTSFRIKDHSLNKKSNSIRSLDQGSQWKFKNKFILNQSSSSSISSEDKSNTRDRDIATELLKVITITKNNAIEKNNHSDMEERIRALLTKLEKESNMDTNVESIDRFQSLIGLYTVAQVLTKNKNENPVGGKWTRKNSLAQLFLKSRRTFQHIIEPSSKSSSFSSSDTATTTNSTNSTNSINSSREPIVAEAINVISLDALFGLIRITVMLRGDAIPLSIEERNKLQLSNYAVRAYFDPPRIVFGKHGRIFNIHLGPKSSVILDTTYIDDRVRIGKGGMSGSRFVFQRCNVTDIEEMEEANEFRSLLARPPLRKSKLKAILLSFLAFGSYNVRNGRHALGTAMLIFTCLGGIIMKFSTGGIEEDQLEAANKNIA